MSRLPNPRNPRRSNPRTDDTFSRISPTDWRFLHRGNDRDILQRNHRTEHEWLRVAQRVHIEQRGRIKRRRWCRQSVDPTGAVIP
jgi:hypothetical protein